MATAFIEMGALDKMNDWYRENLGDDIPHPTLWAYTGDGRTVTVTWVGDNMNMELLGKEENAEDSTTIGVAEMTFTDWANWLEGKGL